jgi:hypothetical protein
VDAHRLAQWRRCKYCRLFAGSDDNHLSPGRCPLGAQGRAIACRHSISSCTADHWPRCSSHPAEGRIVFPDPYLAIRWLHRNAGNSEIYGCCVAQYDSFPLSYQGNGSEWQ